MAANVDKLIDDILAMVPTEDIYTMALERLNLGVMVKAKNVSRKELAVIMAVGGFKAGIAFAVENDLGEEIK